jgi:hypothetical protein
MRCSTSRSSTPRNPRLRDAVDPTFAISRSPLDGYYSKSAQACTWPCSITQMDSADQMDRVYDGVVFWADAVIVASPIRWGSASSLYFKMIERMNCIQNQVTIRDNVLIRNKVASFIITGGQDNIQAVAGQMLVFFTEPARRPQSLHRPQPRLVGGRHGTQLPTCKAASCARRPRAGQQNGRKGPRAGPSSGRQDGRRDVSPQDGRDRTE